MIPSSDLFALADALRPVARKYDPAPGVFHRTPLKGKDGVLHRQLSAAICRETGASIKGFGKSVRSAVGAWVFTDVTLPIPDAYLIETEARTVVAYEVEVTNRLTPRRAVVYGRAIDAFSRAAWTLRLAWVYCDGYAKWLDTAQMVADIAENEALACTRKESSR